MDTPYRVVIEWAIGDAVVVSYPNLQPWEARALLEEAINIILDAETEDAEEEEAEP